MAGASKANGRHREAGGATTAPPRLLVKAAAWLSDWDLLMVGNLPGAMASALAGRPSTSRGPSLLLLPDGGAAAEPDTATVLVVWPVHRDQISEVTAVLPLNVLASEIGERTGSLQDLTRAWLAWQDPPTRAGILGFLLRATSTAIPSPRRAGRGVPLFTVEREVRLSAALHSLREGLRERLPVTLTHDGPMALVDAVARLDRDAFFVRGRVRAGASSPTRVTVVSPEGSRVEILERAYWYDPIRSRDKPGEGAWKGFAVFITCDPSVLPEGWLVELETRSGHLLEVGAPKVATSTSDVIRTLLEELSVERLPATKLRTGQVVPAVRRLQRARQRLARVERIVRFGHRPASPAISVIVPLYRRIDFVEHQLAQMADDPSFQAVDLVFVLDSPELEDELLEAARRLHALYRQPFRTAILSHNVGFAGANNLGVSIAEGRLVLLLNSDVFPEAPGWIDAMVAFHDSCSNPGAIGPKLLYEDDTLQHAGMFFERLSETQPWNNEHYFKGMHRDIPAAAESRPVPAVTGACLLIARDLYLKMGGLSGDYLQGDFEDSDLCLRLLEAGRQNWYFADVALYHLEASSYDPERRRLHDGFNRWFHTHLWADRLRTLSGLGVARPTAPEPPPAPAVKEEVTAGAAGS